MRLPEFYFSMFDLDTNIDGKGIESMEQDEFEVFFVAEPTEIELSFDDGMVSALATQKGSIGDNPNDPNNLSELQMKRSITFLFRNKRKFEVEFCVKGGVGGRNFLFGPGSQIAPDCSHEKREDCEKPDLFADDDDESPTGRDDDDDGDQYDPKSDDDDDLSTLDDDDDN